MRICPYVSFNGNCAEAVAFYEKAFNVKANVMRYNDAPPEDGYQPLRGNLFELNAVLAVVEFLMARSDVPTTRPPTSTLFVNISSLPSF